MKTLADVIMYVGAHDSAPAVDHVRAVAAWLPDADRRRLSAADLARIDAYHGRGEDLHELLPTVLPLERPVWFESTITAQRGTTMHMGYGATAADNGIDVYFASFARGTLIGPLGPARCTPTGMDGGGDGDAARELRVAAGIVIRALLLNLGTT